MGQSVYFLEIDAVFNNAEQLGLRGSSRRQERAEPKLRYFFRND